MLELTLIFVIDVLILAVLWPLVIKPLFNRVVTKRLNERDESHGH